MSKLLELLDYAKNSGFSDFPPIAFEVEYDEMGNPPPFGKYMKPVNRTYSLFNTVWLKQLEYVQTFHNMKYLFDSIFTDQGMLSLLKMVANIEIESKELDKAIKAAGDPFVKEYYTKRGYDSVVKQNMFDLLRSDLEEYYPLFKERYDDYKDQYTTSEFNHFTMELSDVLGEYKNVLKAEKEERKKKSK